MENHDSNTQSYRALVAGEFVAFWRALMARVKLAAPVGFVLAAIGCVGLWYFTEPKYGSQATLEIRESRPHLAFQTDEKNKTFVETQVELLRNPYIVGRAIDTERLASLLPELRDVAGKEDAVRWIAERLKIARVSQSDLFEVSFTTRYPESAKSVVDAIVKTYMNYQATESDHQRHKMLDLLTTEQSIRDTDIELKRQKLRDMKQQAGGEVGHGNKLLELQFAQDELNNAEEVRRRIAERAMHLTIESRAPSQVSLVQMPKVPEFPEGPTLAAPLAVVVGTAFLAPLILLFVWDLLHLRSRARAATTRYDD